MMRLRLGYVVCLIMALLVWFMGCPVLADDDSSDKTITLTINWMDDQPSDRPESITVMLYRTEDDEETPMESKEITSSDAVSENSWEATFEYVYGYEWEYAFRILETEPYSALFSYRLDESGNGTDHYTFDYYYGQGDTEMTIEVKWDDDSNALGLRPDSVSVALDSLSDSDDKPERTVLVKGEKDEDTWTAQVTGLENDPANYFITLVDLPEEYQNLIERGDTETEYVSTNTVKTAASEAAGSGASGPQGFVGAVNSIASVLTLEESHKGSTGGLVICLILGVALIIMGVVAYRRQREERLRDGEKKNDIDGGDNG